MQTKRTLTALAAVAAATVGLVAAAHAASGLPAFYLVGGPADAPDREICLQAGGALFVRARCNAREEALSPTALVVCRQSTGRAVLRGIACAAGETPTDLREVRGMPPASILETPAARSKGDATKAVLLEDSGASTGHAAIPGLCRDLGTGVTVRTQCGLAEIPLDVSALKTCVTPSGIVRLRASYCAKRDEDLDLRELLGPVRRVGIGPLVGLLLRVADIPAEYGQ